MPDAPVVAAAFTWTPKELIGSYRATHPVAYGLRWVAATVLVLTGVVRGDPFGIVLGLTVFAVSAFAVYRQLQPRLQHLGPVRVRATEETFEVGDTPLPWSAFASARRTMRFWVLRRNRAVALALPRRVFDAEQAAAFEALLRRRGLR